MMTGYRYHIVAVLSFLVPSSLTAQDFQPPADLAPPTEITGQEHDKKPEEGPRTFQLVVHPAAEPQPALKYRLLPRLLDCKPGNAAVMYGRAFAERRIDWPGELAQFLESPVTDLPAERLKETLAKLDEVLCEHRHLLDTIHSAARRERCEWELPFRETNPFTIRFPLLQKMQQGAILLALQAQRQIAQGDYENAVGTLQTGYALARHAAQGETLISGLVGVAACDYMSSQVRQLIQRPDSPNLYWALASLPRPFVDLRSAFELEADALYLSIPELRDLETPQPDEHWRNLIDKVTHHLTQIAVLAPEAHGQAVAAFRAIKAYPAAKRFLIQQRRSPEEVDAMPVPQVVVIHAMRTYEQARDDMFRWFALPYWQAHERLQESEDRLRRVTSKEVFPLASVLLRSLSMCHFAVAKNDRTIAMLRAVEALRLHAHSNGGKLPDRLDHVTVVPVPIDPLTGKLFRYHTNAEGAVLESLAPPGKHPIQGLRFEIKMVNP